jgi:GH15 family glucan-1,4-alpha-glucosidase
MAMRIEDYALLGDCETAALVGRDGSVDWLCLPRFDSAACFAALLGTPANGRFLLAPAAGGTAVRRRYRTDTLILESEHETPEGAVTVIDFMPPRTAEPDLVRIVVGTRGRVAMRMELVIRFDYGSIVPWTRPLPGGVRAIAGPDSLFCQAGVELRIEDRATVADFIVAEGQRVPFLLTWHPSYEPPPSILGAEKALARTERWWREWVARDEPSGEFRDDVVRSLITLKALTHARTGGIVAAPTTSLPERLGGVRNWDYRYCWIRDATFTLYALLASNHREEARAFREWLLRAVAGNPGRLQIMYGIAGERRLTEMALPWLPGYEGSAPVRVGNAASLQRQWDVYGEILDAMFQGSRTGIAVDNEDFALERALLDQLESYWKEPDEGIWETRGPPQHFTHSKVMAWVAFDRAVKQVERSGLDGPLDRWRALRSMIHTEVCERGFDRRRGTFVQAYGSGVVDASLLMIPLVGFLPASDPRVAGTVRAIEEDLMEGGLLRRYRRMHGGDGLPPGEGSFLACSFWLADNLVLLGRRAEARALFERLLGLRNDLGLLSEEYSVSTNRMLGNFPQAFSHVGLVNTARNLSAAPGGPAEDRGRS